MQEKKVRKAVITDAGFASRYLPITKTIPKAMLPIGNRPIMQFVVEECVEAGIEEIVIVATPEGKPIYEDYFNNSVNRIRKQLASQGKEDRYQPVQHILDFPKIIVIEQDPSLPYGNGSPIVSAQNFLSDEEAFLALYSDDVVFGSSDAKTLINSYAQHPEAKAIIMAQEMDESVLDKYGIISLKDKKCCTLSHIVEKPKKDAPSNLTSYGRYLLTQEVFSYLDPKNIGLDGELWTVDAITKMAVGGNVYVERTKGQWMTTGDPANYFLAHLRFVLDNESYADEVRGIIK
ncbi:sugar phosphate nucleotidyltransferase [Microgenomates group bacterium]|nr:sugar phosphate nucleotidyltransferase [Microgenomates group bacterium]